MEEELRSAAAADLSSSSIDCRVQHVLTCGLAALYSLWRRSSGKEAPEVEMSIPGLDWGMDEVMGKDSKKVPQKKVPYAKPIPAQFQQAWADNKVPMMPPGGDKERKGDPSDPELGFNPQLEQMKMSSDGNMGPPQGSMPPFSGPGGPGGPMPPGQQGFPPNMPPQQMPNNMGPPMQPPFMPPGQMGPPSGPQAHQGPHQGMMGPPDMQRHPGPPRNMGPQGPHGMGPRGMQGPHGGMMGPPPRGMGPRDPQGPPPQGGMMPPQGGMMGPPPRTQNNYGMGNMQGPPGGMHGPPGNMQGPPGNMQGASYMQNSGPMMHGMGSQGSNNKDPRGPPPNHHMGPPERQGGGQDQGSGQGSGPYWGEQQGRRGPQDFEGGQDFHNRAEEGWRPGVPRGPQRGGGNWGSEERFPGGEFRGRRDDRFRGSGRPGARGFPEEFSGSEEGFEGPEDGSRGWDPGARGGGQREAPPRSRRSRRWRWRRRRRSRGVS
ncbi:hypothetical protein CesoFtcFv8_000095 [Champsocephalus esox]|nr:hypothetical protein CesoFtcFv8_000095 [Champsocephalus esox]